MVVRLPYLIYVGIGCYFQHCVVFNHNGSMQYPNCIISVTIATPLNATVLFSYQKLMTKAVPTFIRSRIKPS